MDLLLLAVPLALGGAGGALVAALVRPDARGTSPLSRWRRVRSWRRRSLGGGAAPVPGPRPATGGAAPLTERTAAADTR